jgi:hypothetical protein
MSAGSGCSVTGEARGGTVSAQAEALGSGTTSCSLLDEFVMLSFVNATKHFLARNDRWYP